MIKTFYTAVATLLLAACNTGSIRDSVSGTYIRYEADEAGKLWDTLVIKQISGKTPNLFSVTKNSGIHYQRDSDRGLPPDHKSSHFTATYHPDEHTLDITEMGASYAVDSKKNTLSNGQVTFTKLK